MKTIKLYDIPGGSKIACTTSDGSTYVIFNNLDGLFSRCTTENGGTVHLSATQEVNIGEDGAYFL